MILLLILFFCLVIFLFCVVKLDPRFALLEFEELSVFRVTVIARSWFLYVVILTPGIAATSLNGILVAKEFWLKCTVIGKIFRVAVLSKLFRPPFVDTVSFSWFLHVMIYFTKSVLFETLFVEHVSSSNHVCLISAQLFVRITTTCDSFIPVWFGHWSKEWPFRWHE